MPTAQRCLLALLLSLSLPAVAQNHQDDAALAARLQSLAQGFHGQLSLYAQDLATGRTVSLDADQPVPTASVIKLGVLYTALEQIRADKVHFEDRLTLRKEDQVPGSGVLLLFDTPLTLTLKDALSMMITQSDNTATNLVIDHLGLQAIDEELSQTTPEGLGLKNTRLYKKVFRPAQGPMRADQKEFGLGKTTAREMASIMERFADCHLGPAPASSPAAAPSAQDLCNAALHMLRSQFYRNSIPRYLERLDTTKGESAIANKTGALDHVRNDVGAVFTPQGTIVISEFTHDNKDTSWTPDNQAEVLMARLAAAIVDAWVPNSMQLPGRH